MADEHDWLDPIVRQAIDRNIERLAKGRDPSIVNERSREILTAFAHDVVLDVLTELCEEDAKWTQDQPT